MRKLLSYCIVMTIIFMACEPRIDLEEGQWGDHAFLTNVQVFKIKLDDEAEMQEYYNTGKYVTSAQRIIISKSCAIDEDNFIATVTMKPDEELDPAGLFFYHKAKKIEPLSGAPTAGLLSNLSGASFKYRVYSADGTTHDWTVNIVE